MRWRRSKGESRLRRGRRCAKLERARWCRRGRARRWGRSAIAGLPKAETRGRRSWSSGRSAETRRRVGIARTERKVETARAGCLTLLSSAPSEWTCVWRAGSKGRCRCRSGGGARAKAERCALRRRLTAAAAKGVRRGRSGGGLRRPRSEAERRSRGRRCRPTLTKRKPGRTRRRGG